jgi:hypothetical protein
MIIKYLFPLIIIIPFSIDAYDRPDSVPSFAQSINIKGKNSWYYKNESLFMSWKFDGTLEMINLLQRNVMFEGRYNEKNNTAMRFSQSCTTGDPEEGYPVNALYGRYLIFDDSGSLSKLQCYSPVDFIKQIYDKKSDGLCGDEIIYNKNVSIKEKIKHPPCDNPCGFFQPYIGKGEFEIVSDVNVRSKPSTDSKSLGLIKKGEKIQVIKDTEYLELLYGNIAPWVEVNFNGKKGYVFGGLLKFLFIPAESIDIENLKKLKFIGKAPESCKDLMFKDPGKEKREKESQEKKR